MNTGTPRYQEVGYATLVFGLPLSPCAHCGSDGAYIQLRDVNGHRPVSQDQAHTYVACCGDDNCGLQSGRCDTPQEAAARWNLRVKQPAPEPNDFVSVLWRGMAHELHYPAGWTIEDVEKNFRRQVNRTLEEFPPEIPASQPKGSR